MRTRQENPATREKLFETAQYLMLAKTRQDLDVIANNPKYFKNYLKSVFKK